MCVVTCAHVCLPRVHIYLCSRVHTCVLIRHVYVFQVNTCLFQMNTHVCSTCTHMCVHVCTHVFQLDTCLRECSRVHICVFHVYTCVFHLDTCLCFRWTDVCSMCTLLCAISTFFASDDTFALQVCTCMCQRKCMIVFESPACVCVCALGEHLCLLTRAHIVFHVYTHVCFDRTRGVSGHIFVFQWYTYVCPTCTHMCALVASVLCSR